jgi:hypothetical protein
VTISKLDQTQILQDVHDLDNHRLKVDIGGATIDANIGDVTVAPSTDFRPRTYTVTGTPTAITFGGFAVTGITIKALANPGFVRIGKSDVLSSPTNFYLLSPSESLSMSLDSSVGVYFCLHPGEPAGDYFITVLAIN